MRRALAELFESARTRVLVAVPYFRQTEAIWLSDRLATADSHVQLSFLTDLKSDSILSGSLQLSAFTQLAARFPHLSVVNLPRLHAKVYVADQEKALITSANLTKSGLDDNFEYGVFLYDSAVVSEVTADLSAYAEVGSKLSIAAISQLDSLAEELQTEYAQLHRAASRRMRTRFEQKLRHVDLEFLKAQVGSRSRNSLFGDAIRYLLRDGGLSTRALHPRIKSLLPELCDDRVELIINGQRYGKRWKHAVRNAQAHLRRSGIIEPRKGVWYLCQPQAPGSASR